MAADNWYSPAALRRLLAEPAARMSAHWSGPDTARPDAAFLAAHVPQSGVRSIVALKDGPRIRFDGKSTVSELPLSWPMQRSVSSLDLDGVLLERWAILFHTEQGLLRSAFSFDTGTSNEARLRILVTGVAPGVYEIWRNGWLVDAGVVVRATEAVLYFEERPGSFFVRKLN